MPADINRDMTMMITLVLTLYLAAAGAAGAQASAKAEGKKSEALKDYAGRYELEVGLIPVSTLDVTLSGGELWLKPSNVKRRRLARGRRDAFTDEVAGPPAGFGRDDEGRVVSLTFVYEG